MRLVPHSVRAAIARNVDQYAEVSTSPRYCYVAEVLARFGQGACVIVYWAIAWPKVEESKLFLVPVVLFASIVWSEIILCHVMGPITFNGTKMAGASMCAQIVLFSFVTVYPIFLPVHQKPFRTRFQQSIGSTMTAFCGCLFAQTNAIVEARKHGIQTESQSLFALLFAAGDRAARFLDCWTDAEVSVSLLNAASEETCTWVDGTSRCGLYHNLAVANLACSLFDYLIVVTFAVAGQVMESSGKRLKRVAVALHCTAFLIEGLIIVVNVLYILCLRKARLNGDQIDHRGSIDTMAMTVVSIVLTLISFTTNVFGAQKVAQKLMRVGSIAAARIAPSLATYVRTSIVHSDKSDCAAWEHGISSVNKSSPFKELDHGGLHSTAEESPVEEK